MALMNCPECNKEMSDTIKKCPHCGFVIKKKKVKKEKKDNKEKLNFKGKLTFLYEKTIKNKWFWIIGGVVVLGIVLLLMFLSSIQVTKARKMMEYLEDEDYKCKETNYFGGYYWWSEGYVCILEEDGYTKKFLIGYSGDAFDRIDDYYVETALIYSDDDYYFRLLDDVTVVQLGYYNLRTNSLYKRYEEYPDMDYTIDGRRIEYDECDVYFDDPDSIYYDYEGVLECNAMNEHYENYAKKVKDAIEEMEDLYDEVNQEINREEW